MTAPASVSEMVEDLVFATAGGDMLSTMGRVKEEIDGLEWTLRYWQMRHDDAQKTITGLVAFAGFAVFLAFSEAIYILGHLGK